jgi:hypothetical protein
MVVSKVRPCCSKVIVYCSGNRDYISPERVIVEGNRLDFFPKTACQGWQRRTQLDSSWDKTSEFKKGWFTRWQAALLLRSHLRLCRQGWFVVCCSGTIPRFSAHSTMSRTRSKCRIVGIEGPLQFFVCDFYIKTHKHKTAPRHLFLNGSCEFRQNSTQGIWSREGVQSKTYMLTNG